MYTVIPITQDWWSRSLSHNPINHRHKIQGTGTANCTRFNLPALQQHDRQPYEINNTKGGTEHFAGTPSEYRLRSTSTAPSRFTTGLRSRIFGCNSNRRKTSTI